MRMRENREDKFAGALLGTAFGDTLGAPVEGMSAGHIRRSHGDVRDFLPVDGAVGRYTDDTQMTLALARSIVRCGGVDGADCARSYAELYEPERGYGRSAHAVLAALRQGADYRETGTLFFPEGSFGNGGAMRIAPVGLVYGSQAPQRLRELVFQALRCTHIHPEAVDGAVVQARAVGRMVALPEGGFPGIAPFLSELSALCRTAALQHALKKTGELLETGASDGEVGDRLGTGVSSAESVPAALFIFLRHGAEPEEALVRAVGLGGDTDTVAAMVGALCGALHGAGRFPRRWYEGLENGPRGRDEIVKVARELAGVGL